MAKAKLQHVHIKYFEIYGGEMLGCRYQAPSVCTSANSSLWIRTGVENWWNGANRGGQNYRTKNMLHCHLFYGQNHSRKVKTKINLNYTQKIKPYRAVNTLRLCYKNQSVDVV